jgi:6-pyruvoyl-tetrahydropterin synthase
MAQHSRPVKCANCLYPLDEPAVVVNGEPYCCTGCAQGGPCICSYGHSPILEQLPALGGPGPGAGLPSGGKSGSITGEAFTRMVENMVKEVEITRQVVKDASGPVNDLLNLLQKCTRLLQVMAHRLEGTAPPDAGSPTRSLSPVLGPESWEKISLVVENATEPDIAFSYTRALGKLDSVRDIKLVSLNKTNLLYRVETTSKARFAREVMSLPDFRPVRIQATLDEITVLLDRKRKVVPADLEKLLAGTDIGEPTRVAQVEAPPPAAPEGPPVPEPAAPKKGGPGVMEAGIDGFFNSRHYFEKDGKPGPVESKSWRVEISLEGDQFDQNGMLSGFVQAQAAVARLMSGYNNQLLNKLEPFSRVQPTPENIARTLHRELKAAIAEQPLRLKGLKVWASPTQYVWYSEPPGHET